MSRDATSRQGLLPFNAPVPGMVLDRLRGRLRGQDPEDYIDDLDPDTSVTVTMDMDVSRYNGPFATSNRPLDEATLYVTMDAGEDSYRQDVGSVLLEPGGSYLTTDQEDRHEAVQDTATELVDEWTGMLDDAGRDFDEQ